MLRGRTKTGFHTFPPQVLHTSMSGIPAQELLDNSGWKRGAVPGSAQSTLPCRVWGHRSGAGARQRWHRWLWLCRWGWLCCHLRSPQGAGTEGVPVPEGWFIPNCNCRWVLPALAEGVLLREGRGFSARKPGLFS